MRPLLAAAALGLTSTAALAGETACWFEHGLLVAPAQVMGVAGDFIVDTATPQTRLHDTAAQGAGFADAILVGAVRIAGVTQTDRLVTVADLDSRGWMLAVPLAGVIGADVLKAYVVDVQFSPCRLRLSPAGSAPRFSASASLPLAWIGGRPAVTATVADDATAGAGQFALGSGVDAPIRLSDAAASVPGVDRPQELYPNGVLRPRLRALSLAGVLQEELASGLEKDQGTAGVIGAPALARWRLRFDFPGGRLLLAPAPSPVSAGGAGKRPRR